ncbi:MAG: hypothetical protein R3213_11985, partial [Flavobacteriaceae bacterium]|nr:hypothetical protein [Flavobacteriaceae bacterium]
DKSLQETLNLDHNIIYAHQLSVCKDSEFKVRVLKSYFKGEYYLVEAEHDKKPILFYHSHELEKDREVYLSIIS